MHLSLHLPLLLLPVQGRDRCGDVGERREHDRRDEEDDRSHQRLGRSQDNVARLSEVNLLHQLPIDLGPESAVIEVVDLPFW